MDQGHRDPAQEGLCPGGGEIQPGRQGRPGRLLHPHERRIGVLVELNCESDFVARNCEFQELAKELGMQIAAAKPRWIASTDVPRTSSPRRKRSIQAQLGDMKKPPEIMEKIVQGKLGQVLRRGLPPRPALHRETNQGPGPHHPLGAKMGENIKVGRFARFEIGQD